MFVVGLIVFAVLIHLANIVFSDSSKTRTTATTRPSRNSQPDGRVKERGKLSLVLKEEDLAAGDSGKVRVASLAVWGRVVLPAAGTKVHFRLQIVDVTDGAAGNGQAVICLYDDLSDKNGVFHFLQPMVMPHEDCALTGLHLVTIPIELLVAPRSGRRTLAIRLWIESQSDSSVDFAHGTTNCAWTLPLPGYIESAETAREKECRAVLIAHVVAAVDGNIDHRETMAIRKRLIGRRAGRGAPEAQVAAVESLMVEARSAIRMAGSSTSVLMDLLKATCAQLQSQGDEAASNFAYELAVLVVAGDGKVDDHENEAIGLIARTLRVNPQFVRELHDRHLRASMYSAQRDTVLVGMPAGLSHAEQCEFIAAEYRKWRGRVTHSDPQVAAEASLRLEQLANAKVALESSNDKAA